MNIVLRKDEIAELMRQHPKTERDGGFQSLMVRLQKKLDHTSSNLSLNAADIERISRYAFSYGNGGWENRLMAIFSRTLGPKLNGK